MDRATFESQLATIVSNNRVTIAVIFPVVGAVVLVASAEGLLPSGLAYNPLLILFGTAVMRLPLVAGVIPVVTRRALVAVGILMLYTWLIEMVGVATGWPYGEFTYGVSLGPMLFGVPLALPLFFIPLVMNAYLFAIAIFPRRSCSWWFRIPVVTGLVVAIDLILDPAAVAIGFWSFDAGGAYYDVPWSNYAGWLLSGTLAVLVIDAGFSRSGLRSRVDECEFVLDDLVSFTLLWGAINLLYGNWIPVLVTLVFVLGLARAGRLTIFTARQDLLAS